MKPRVELVYDQDCPNVPEARAVLLEAFARAQLSPTWSEWDSRAADAPAYAQQYGSPTILVDGCDVVGLAPSATPECCRVYDDGRGGSLRRVPSVDTVFEALIPSHARPGSSGRGLFRGLAVAPGAGAALLPVGVCPACWPAYAGLLSSLGLGFLLETTYLLPITAVLFLAALVSLAHRARERHGYRPLILGSAAATLALLGKFAASSDLLLYTGLALLVGASLWHAWPRRAASAGSCSQCATQTPATTPTSAPTRTQDP